jgi:biopolymer transport protein ExbB
MWLMLLEARAAIQDFLETGGNVLYVIGFVTLVMWTLIVERWWYYRTQYPKLASQVIATWEAREETKSWYAHKIRAAMISQVTESLNASIPMIKTLVALCPLLGLLGTVTGMVEVFDVMAITGSGNARAMASGVSKATIPTMAGMVVAISGVFFSTRLERYAAAEAERTADQLTQH